MHIEKNLYKISDNNRYKTKTVKTQIVLGTSLRKSDYHITRLQHKEHGITKKWNTYTISRDGTVFQHFDDKFHSDFLGKKIGDRQSISIIIENMGYLIKTPDGKYINWLDEVCNEKHVVEKKHIFNYWEKFTSKQIESTVMLCRNICDKHNIPKICIDFQHYHKDISKFKGIVFRSNYIEDSSDFNPIFEIPKFNEMLRNEFI